MDLSEGKTKMTNVVSFLRSELAKMRTGKASAELLDSITVETYGSRMPIKHVASISVPDTRTITIQPWDKANAEPIYKAIMTAEMGFNPTADGQLIRISIPPLTQERREEFVKVVKAKVEDSRVAIRQLRNKMMDALDEQEKAGGVSEDDIKRQKDEVEKDVEKVIKEIEVLADNKEKEIMTV